jgi:hypothetical protein
LTCAEVEVAASNIKGEDDAIVNLPARFQWRCDLERNLLELSVGFKASPFYAASVVVRPGFVYGGPGGLFYR